MRYRVQIRRFLNVLGYNAGAYILAAVEDSSKRSADKDKWSYLDIDLTMADCGRVVSFDFDLSTRGARRNSIRKIDIMIDTLVQFRGALKEEARLAGQREHRKTRDPR